MNKKMLLSARANHSYSNNNISPQELEEFYKIKKDNIEGERGAVILITDKQLVIALNENNYNYNHRETLVNAYRRIYRKKKIVDPIEYVSIEKEVHKNFIVCRLINDPDGAGVYAAFPISLISPHSISSEQLSVFESFYEEYNYVFKEASINHKKPIVCFSYTNDKNETNEIWSNDLTPLLEYLRKIVNPNKSLYQDDEKIVGGSFSKKLSKR